VGCSCGGCGFESGSDHFFFEGFNNERGYGWSGHRGGERRRVLWYSTWYMVQYMSMNGRESFSFACTRLKLPLSQERHAHTTQVIISAFEGRGKCPIRAKEQEGTRRTRIAPDYFLFRSSCAFLYCAMSSFLRTMSVHYEAR
jgi:hypothetical protein